MDRRGNETTLARRSKAANLSPVTLTHKDYNVGWICALSIEQTAAVAMLDEVHQSLPKPAQDQNTYTLGSIAKHNVVVACLPKGRYATIPAAQVAIWMMGTFPSIKIGVMVGIGGGIPPKVRLGHIVVSTPSGEYPGVVQWDMGKTVDGGRFERTGALNNPPTALLTALTKLETQHDMYGSRITLYLDRLAEQFPRLKSTYTWSEMLQDPLNTPATFDTAGVSTGVMLFLLQRVLAILWYLLGWRTLASSSLDPKLTVSDKADVDGVATGKLATSGEPVIHYGLIASGNQVIKDASFRDRLNESFGGNLLCVEMEAAGLMHNFPCIVIRGVCDYADMEKNEDWQGYAAGVAAAYAKELLEVTDPVDVEHAPEARIITQMLDGIKSMTETIITRQEQQTAQEERSKLFSWLSPLQPFARQTEMRHQRVQGTGMWLLKHHRYLEWLSVEAAHPVLCCYGDPGVGKTFISSLVIENLEDMAAGHQRIAVGYVYCDYRDQETQTVTNILGAILRQLLAHLPTVPESVWQVCRDKLRLDSIARLEDIQSLVSTVYAEFDKVYICLDALDELRDVRQLIEHLRDRPSQVQLYLTCRPHVLGVIEQSFGEVQSITIEAQEEDLRLFVEHEIGGLYDQEPDAIDDDLREELCQRIVDSAQGVFLLPVLQIRAVLTRLTISERKHCLQTLPSTLGEAFAESFQRLEQQPPTLANRAAQIIAWVLLFTVPLTVDKLLCSLTVKENDRHFDHLRIPVKKNLLNCCQGLVTIDEETSAVRLVHYALQEYLQEQQKLFSISKKIWHDRIAAICITYLKFPTSLATFKCLQEACGHYDYSVPPSGNNSEDDTGHDFAGKPDAYRIQRALIKDAAMHWGHHLRKGDESRPSTVRLAMEYLCVNPDEDLNNARLNSVSLSDLRLNNVQILYRNLYCDYGRPNGVWNAVHIAAFFGLREVMSRLASTGFDIDARDQFGETPLSWASREGHETLVQMLLEKDVTLDPVGRHGRTPLSLAVRREHEIIVRLLLEKGAAVNSADWIHAKPLSWASLRGNDRIVRLLIEYGATLDTEDSWGQTPLMSAIDRGHETVVRVLLENGATMYPAREYSGKLLSQVSECCSDETLQDLLDNGAPVNFADDYGWTALTWAVYQVRETHVRILLENGALLNPVDKDGRTPVSWASGHGSPEIVRLLLENGAAVNQVDTNGRTALWWASKLGHVEEAELLLRYGATEEPLSSETSEWVE